MPDNSVKEKYNFFASVYSPTRVTLAGYWLYQVSTFAEAEQKALSLFRQELGENEDCIVISLEREFSLWK